MPEYCTCGTRLVEDARFCHRCGRPTQELSAAPETDFTPPPLPETAVAASVPAVTPPAQLPVSFSNPIALRVSMMMAMATLPAALLPGVNGLIVVWWVAAGGCAVLLYRRLTGASLSVGAGARLGSITGVLAFVGIAILFAVSMIFTSKEFFEQMEQVTKGNPEAAQVLHDPTMMFFALLMALAVMGAFAVGCCAAGGALGARFTARKAN